MAVKVVHGLIRDNQSQNPQQNQQTQAQTPVAATIAAQAQQISTHFTRNSEAVQVAVRTNRASSLGDRLGDPKQARELAEKLADFIRGEDDPLEAHHGLDRGSGPTPLV